MALSHSWWACCFASFTFSDALSFTTFFLSFSLAAVTNSMTWPEPGVTLVCSGKRLPSAEHQFIEADFHFPSRREIRIQRRLRALAARERLDLRDFSDDLRTNRHDNAVECINRLHDAPVDRLPHLSYPDFPIQGDLQGRAFRDGQSNRLRRRGLSGFTGGGCRLAFGTSSGRELGNGNLLGLESAGPGEGKQNRAQCARQCHVDFSAQFPVDQYSRTTDDATRLAILDAKAGSQGSPNWRNPPRSRSSHLRPKTSFRAFQ